MKTEAFNCTGSRYLSAIEIRNSNASPDSIKIPVQDSLISGQDILVFSAIKLWSSFTILGYLARYVNLEFTFQIFDSFMNNIILITINYVITKKKKK